MEGRMVDAEELRRLILYWKKVDPRGYPIHKKRDKTLWREKPSIRLPVNRRLEIIRRQIESMTDDEQIRVLSLGAAQWFRMFRLEVLAKLQTE